MPQKGKHTPQGKKRKNKIPNISDANNAAGHTIGTPAHVITEKPLIKNNTVAATDISAKYSELPSELMHVAAMAGVILILMIILWLILK
jgi:hypothetical protein